MSDRFELTDCVPRVLGQKAAAGNVVAGLLPIVDFFQLSDTFERLGHIGIAVRGRAHSVLLFSRRPIRQLDGAIIAVTEETSTSAVLLRLLLEQRYQLHSMTYERRRSPEADALLLIGDEALQFQQTNRLYPFEIDVAFEWWLWQHRPFVFAVWAIRKDIGAHEKKSLEAALMKSLTINSGDGLTLIAQEYSTALGVPADELRRYLSNFVYRLGRDEEDAMTTFQGLIHEHHLL